jgi:hypothetical protein
VSILKDMSQLLSSIRRRPNHKRDGDDMNGNGSNPRGPSEAERRLLAEEIRRFEQALRELAKS